MIISSDLIKVLSSPFPKPQIFDSSKLKEFADDFKFEEIGRKFSNWLENTVGKGEIARYEQFLLYPQCFQKTCIAEKIQQTFYFANWVQNKGSLSRLCIAPGVFIRRNMVDDYQSFGLPFFTHQFQLRRIQMIFVFILSQMTNFRLFQTERICRRQFPI